MSFSRSDSFEYVDGRKYYPNGRENPQSKGVSYPPKSFPPPKSLPHPVAGLPRQPTPNRPLPSQGTIPNQAAPPFNRAPPPQKSQFVAPPPPQAVPSQVTPPSHMVQPQLEMTPPPQLATPQSVMPQQIAHPAQVPQTIHVEQTVENINMGDDMTNSTVEMQVGPSGFIQPTGNIYQPQATPTANFATPTNEYITPVDPAIQQQVGNSPTAILPSNEDSAILQTGDVISPVKNMVVQQGLPPSVTPHQMSVTVNPQGMIQQGMGMEMQHGAMMTGGASVMPPPNMQQMGGMMYPFMPPYGPPGIC